MAETDPGGLADHFEEEADDLEQRSKKLKEQTDDVAQDWERKRSDPNVPGAPEPPEEEESEDDDDGPADDEFDDDESDDDEG